MATTNESNGTGNAYEADGANGSNGHSLSPLCSVEDFLSHDYDFVICGGGTAGLAVAARLSENANIKVGVIEAGKCKLGDILVDTPALFTQMLGNEEYDWNFKTTPQKGNHDIVHHMPRGKLLGGSSGINYMMYVRGSNGDYDDWAELVKDPSWDSQGMKNYMKKHQTLEPIDKSVTDRSTMPYVGEHHGTTGPVRTSFNDFPLPITDDIIKGCDAVSGYDRKPTDPWSGDHIGFFNTLGTVIRTGPNKGKRSYSARGYYEANKDRPNLKVICEALVNRVILDGTKATGVNFSQGGATHEVMAKHEVIVCGGTIQSPQILELSGIGDPEVLGAAGVECRVNLPGVGNNFQDHCISATGYQLTKGNMSLDGLYQKEAMEGAMKALTEQQSGPLTCISSCQGFFPYKIMVTPEELKETIRSIEDAPTQTKFERQQLDLIIRHLEDDKSANLQLVIVPASTNLKEGIRDQAKLFPPPSDPSTDNGVMFFICLQYPASRGSIHISSSDPTQHPIIDPAYLKHPADRAVLAAGLKFCDRVANNKFLLDKIAKRTQPDPNVDLQDLKQGEQAVTDFCAGEYHPVGSCAMGDVLDSKLRVKGVQGLRVIDASVFPNNVSGNICSSVYSVAEKGADIIKEEYRF